MLDKDRALLYQNLTERREAAADEAVAMLRQELTSLVERLEQMSVDGAADAAVVEFTSSGVRRRSGRLPFVPSVLESSTPQPEVFAKADRLEFAEGKAAQAIAILEPLARERDPQIRAGAYLRLARNYRKTGNLNAALEAYKRLEQERGARLDGVPADLVAQRARCVLLAELKRDTDLRRESCALLSNLRAGTWQISPAAYEVNLEDAAAWCGDDPGRDIPARALSETVVWLWERIGPSPSAPGWDSTVSQGRFITVVWKPAGGQSLVLVAGPEYLERRWLTVLHPICRIQGVSARLLDPETPPPAGQAVRLASATGLPWTLAVAGAAPEQVIREFSARRRLLLAALALVALTVVAGTFFTARALNREVALVQLQADFVAAVSHEFRTPLTSLRNLTEMFTDGRPLDEQTRGRYYRMLGRATGRLDRLVEGLLDFGRIEAGVQMYDRHTLDAAVLASEIVDEFRLDVAGEGFEVEYTAEVGLPPIRADREALGRALRNLLENAMKYSPDCRTIWLEVAHEGDGVAFRVRDRGYGIHPKELKAILRKFVRGEAARLAGVKGTGVGLTIVRHVVEAHQGRLLIESQPGEGSTFTILLPGAEVSNVEGARS
jgi:signal transduction histidine kinase